jgi:hypothetical protein
MRVDAHSKSSTPALTYLSQSTWLKPQNRPHKLAHFARGYARDAKTLLGPIEWLQLYSKLRPYERLGSCVVQSDITNDRDADLFHGKAQHLAMNELHTDQAGRHIR